MRYPLHPVYPSPRQTPAPDEIIGGIKIWLNETYPQIHVTVGVERIRPVATYPNTDLTKGDLKLSFNCPDRSHPKPRPTIRSEALVHCYAECLTIGRFTTGYDDPDFFDKIAGVLDWLLEGKSLSELFFDPWDACEEPPYIPPRGDVLEKVTPRRATTSWVVPIRCRGPPGSKAGTRHDGELPIGVTNLLVRGARPGSRPFGEALGHHSRKWPGACFMPKTQCDRCLQDDCRGDCLARFGDWLDQLLKAKRTNRHGYSCISCLRC